AFHSSPTRRSSDISVGSRCTYPIPQTVGVRPVEICHNGIYLPAVSLFVFERGIYNNTYSKKIIHLLKRYILFMHFVINGIDGLWPSLDAVLEFLLVQFIFQRSNKALNEFIPGNPRFTDLLNNEIIGIRVHKL